MRRQDKVGRVEEKEGETRAWACWQLHITCSDAACSSHTIQGRSDQSAGAVGLHRRTAQDADIQRISYVASLLQSDARTRGIRCTSDTAGICALLIDGNTAEKYSYPAHLQNNVVSFKACADGFDC